MFPQFFFQRINFFLLNVKHRLMLIYWLLKRPSTDLDLAGQSFLSLSARWHGEKLPIFTYFYMINYLNKSNFTGSLLEFGGGFSTILFNLYLLLFSVFFLSI